MNATKKSFAFRSLPRREARPTGETGHMETPKEAFKRLMYRTIAPALQDLHALCITNKAPQEVIDMFSVAIEDAIENRDNVRGLIDTTLEAFPPDFLK
jgi:hypothetical protein